MPEGLATLFIWKVKIVLRVAPCAGALPRALSRGAIRSRPVNKRLHPDSPDGVKDVARANARRPAGFGHAVTEAAPAAVIAVIHA